ncbi:MAG: dihydrofolate reductase [Planctomycetota bacterium]
MKLIAVIAATPTGVIGDQGQMPWQLGSDLKRFKSMTMGGTLIMGRKTFDSIGRPLPGRRTIVVSRDASWSAGGTDQADPPRLATNTDHALEVASQWGDQAFVVGGGQIYRQLLDRCDEVWRTIVWSQVDGDTRLDLDLSPFRIALVLRHPASKRDLLPTEFQRMIR